MGNTRAFFCFAIAFVHYKISNIFKNITYTMAFVVLIEHLIIINSFGKMLASALRGTGVRN
jgi:sorbitol-specific phosphotransferase system component IIBC